jgi:hypothetical protein
MSAIWRKPLWVLVVIVFLVLPASTWARATVSRKQPPTSAEFTVAGTNGYSLYVKSEGGLVTVTAASQRPLESTIDATGRIRPASTGNVATSSYVTSGSPRDPNTIEADLAPFGRISVAFQPSGQTRVTKVNLKGKSERCVGAERIVRRLGTFTGTIEFEGEGGYTTANVSSAVGTVGTSLFRNCTTKVGHRRASASRAGSSQSSTSLIATNPPSFFAAFAESNSPAVGFFASVPESASQQVILVRMAQAIALKGRFVFDDALSSATLTPPAPFSGAGHFRKVRGSAPRWTGSLSVAFPGKTVPLTGPPFHARLAHGR